MIWVGKICEQKQVFFWDFVFFRLLGVCNRLLVLNHEVIRLLHQLYSPMEDLWVNNDAIDLTLFVSIWIQGHRALSLFSKHPSFVLPRPPFHSPKCRKYHPLLTHSEYRSFPENDKDISLSKSS